jgi:hypothetical protein
MSVRDVPELAAVASRIRTTPGTSRVPCPQCDRGDRDSALAVTIDDKGIVWHCHRCHWSGSDLSTVRAMSPLRPTRVAPPVRSPDTALALYAASRPIEPGTVASEYLLARGCVLPPSEGDLRWHPSVRHMAGHVGPALVARVTHAETGEPLSVHRTWIDPTGLGRKADIDLPRTYWAKLPTKHGVVRLWPDDAVTLGLGIAEGIETALALAHAFRPVWACLDAGHMADMPVLGGIEALTIAADHDDAGVRSARACADRWVAAGIEVSIIASQTPGHDIADEVSA